MWAGSMGAPPPGAYGGVQQHQPQQSQQKNDIFVGNLAFNTTEEQLHQAFSDIGRVIKVRLVNDNETGKSKGFAFVEFEDAQAALTAIRNMNDYELNGRRIRVNFSSSSHLEALANKLGMDMSQASQRSGGAKHTGGTASRQGASSSSSSKQQTGAGTDAVADALKTFSKAEMYDVVAQFKEVSDRDPDEARRLLSGHPQLPEAMLYFMSKLDMIQSNVPADTLTGPMPGSAMMTPAVPAAPAVPMRAADPRARMGAASARTDPRTAQTQTPSMVPAPPPPPRADPRARVDPRSASRSLPPPPPPPPMASAPPAQQFSGVPQQPPPQQQQQPPPPGVANLNPDLVQQVMSLTPQQIAQLPPDKQESILALRQQISGSRL